MTERAYQDEAETTEFLSAWQDMMQDHQAWREWQQYREQRSDEKFLKVFIDIGNIATGIERRKEV